jgi:1,4-alpha-glucan branching enzyme
MTTLGAIVTDSGVSFVVWAPHAEEVWVTGTFNDWSDDAHPLAREGDVWSAEVSGAAVGDEYRFVLRSGDQVLHRIDPRAVEVTNSVGNGVVHDHSAFDWQGDDFQIPGHHELVIYELHIGSFNTPDDGIGTFDLALERLDHLVALGVNVIQVMPVAEFAGDYSWGYNPAHPFAVESAYGGPDAFKTFVREVHKRGMAVVLDVVYNHFGPSDLDLWRFDGWAPEGADDKGGIYFFNDHRSSTPWGDTRPDYGRGEVRQYIHDNALMWLRDYHVDGLRWDMTPYVRSVNASGRDIPEGWDLMHWVNTVVREQFPGALLVAEDMHQDPEISRAEGAAFHAQWDSAFVHPVREAVTTPDDQWRSVASVAEAVTRVYNDDAFQRVVYTESHDEVANGRARVPYEVHSDDPTGWHAQKLSTLGAALVMTSPGIPMLFQGQEFLTGGWFRDDVPLDWDQRDDFHGTVRLYRDLIRLRRNWHDTTRGLSGHQVEVVSMDEDANILAFHRWADGGAGDSVVVVVNLDSDEVHDHRIRMPAAGTWTLEFNSDATVYGDDFGDFDSHDIEAVTDQEGTFAAVSVAPYTVLIYSLAG